MNRTIIQTPDAPKPVGPYSQAVMALGTLVFTAGQIALDPATGTMVDGGIEAETRRVVANLAAVLEAAGSGLDRVVKATVFMTDLDDFSRFNAVWSEHFPAEPPARSVIEVSRLPKEARIEIECVALC
jgi:2-iminobutanoate/2-iminopropanoate deaminase